MSQKKSDKGKLFKKLHQLQKRMTRMNINEGHSHDKFRIRKSRIKDLLDAIKGSGRKTRPAF
jgi:hypothetical protein